MKLMKTYRTILTAIAISLFAFSFTSCSDDDEDKEPIFLPYKITDQYGTTEYVYDSKSRLIKSKYFDSNILKSEKIITYNNKGQIEKIEWSSVPKNDYSIIYTVKYVENTITITPNIEIADDYTHTWEITLDNQGRIKKETKYNSNYNYISDFEYDELGNINRIDIEFSDHGYKLYHDLCTYDNKNGIFKNDQTPQWYRVWNRIYFDFFYSVNNQIVYEEYNNLSGRLTEKYTQSYIYNEDNYPIQFISHNCGETTIEYIKR